MFHREKPFRKRTDLFLYLSKVMNAANREKQDAEDTLESRFTKRSLVSAGLRGVRRCFFYIAKEGEGDESGESGWILRKEYNAPGYVEDWTRSLESNELRLLRYFYVRRRREDGIKYLLENTAMKEQEMTAVIEKHLCLGSLIEFNRSLMCVVHDPGYWEETGDNGS